MSPINTCVFLGSGDHYVAQYNAIMGKLLKEEKQDENSVFKCLSEKTNGPEWRNEGIIFNPKKLEVGKKQVNIFGFRMGQNGVLPSENQIESLCKYPTPKNLRDMRGFMGLVNQSTFCLSTATRKLMEKLKGTLKSTKQWNGPNPIRTLSKR